ncbi:ribonuclease H-like domain-containing protein [Tanacetum coccineum]
MSVYNSVHNTPYNSEHNSEDEANPNNVVTLISKLDLSHPFHLHPNDSTTLIVVSIKLKGTENYNVWSCAMIMALEGRNTSGFIDNTCRRSYTYEFLMGLDDSYMQIRSNILSRDPLPDAKGAYVLISSEESHRAVVTGLGTGPSQRAQSFVFNSSIKNRSVSKRSQTFGNTPRPNNASRTNNNGNKRTAGGPALVCENCGYNGHTIDKCFKLIRYPSDFGKKNNANQNNQNFNKRFINNNNSVGSSSTSTSTFSDEHISTLTSLIKENSLNNSGKGVQANMAVNVIDISYLRIKISHPNGTEALITKVDRDNKFIVGFDESKCFLMSQDLMDVKLIGIGKQINGLYYFDSVKSNLSKNCVVSSNNTKLNWHKKLGHPSDQHKSTVLGELVHLDLWGPYRVVSKECHRLPNSVLKGKSPYELVFNKKHCLNHLRVFGCLCFATILNSHDKFNSRAEKCIKHGLVKKPSQDLDHVNFFDEVVHEGLDTSCDDNDLSDQDQGEGSNSIHFSSPTIDHFEDELENPKGSNGLASENEMAATSNPNVSLSKDDNLIL